MLREVYRHVHTLLSHTQTLTQNDRRLFSDVIPYAGPPIPSVALINNDPYFPNHYLRLKRGGACVCVCVKREKGGGGGVPRLTLGYTSIVLALGRVVNLYGEQ